jgi:hypothetical protein
MFSGFPQHYQSHHGLEHFTWHLYDNQGHVCEERNTRVCDMLWQDVMLCDSVQIS